MLTVARATRAYKFARYMERAVKNGATYYFWKGEAIPSQEGAWAENMPAPPPISIDTIFCAGMGRRRRRLLR